jgi:hypothetical protein
MNKLLHTQDTFDTGLIATQDGVHRLLLKFNGQVLVLSETIQSGNPIIFDVTVLNEDYVYTCVELARPDGSREPLDPVQVRVSL